MPKTAIKFSNLKVKLQFILRQHNQPTGQKFISVVVVWGWSPQPLGGLEYFNATKISMHSPQLGFGYFVIASVGKCSSSTTN